MYHRMSMPPTGQRERQRRMKERYFSCCHNKGMLNISYDPCYYDFCGVKITGNVMILWMICVFSWIYNGMDHSKYPYYLTDEDQMTDKSYKIKCKVKTDKKNNGLYVTKCLNISYDIWSDLTMLLQWFSCDKNYKKIWWFYEFLVLKE